MIYLFKTYILVAAVVFGLSGVFILVVVAGLKAKEYARAVMPVFSAARRERFVNSRANSQVHNAGSMRAA